MNHDTLDFTVTIRVPQNAVTTGGKSVILLLERQLLTEEVLGQVEFGVTPEPLRSVRGQIAMELSNRARAQGVHHGTKVEVGNIDIIWADDDNLDAECEVCESCPCICEARQQVGFGTGLHVWEQGDDIWVCIVCGHTLSRADYPTTADIPCEVCK
jgi:hypothetical protein